MTCFWKENRSKIKLENCHLPVSKVRGEIFWKRSFESYTQQSCSCFSNIFYYVLTHVVVVKRQGPLLPWERSRSLSFEEACTGRTNQAPGRLRDSSTNCFVTRTLHFFMNFTSHFRISLFSQEFLEFSGIFYNWLNILISWNARYFGISIESFVEDSENVA